MKKKNRIWILSLAIIGVFLTFITSCEEEDANDSIGTVTDIDGNSYKTVTIGTQIWMTENLKTTKFNDGTPISLLPQDNDWSRNDEPAYCWYNNSMETYKDSYGALYNWHAVYNGSLCPTGWHVPTDEEWTILTDYLGGESTAGGKLKETGNAHWAPPNTDATNETGFTALPGGLRSDDFRNIGEYGYWWTSTKDSSSTFIAWCRMIGYDIERVNRRGESRNAGFSVRCIKD